MVVMKIMGHDQNLSPFIVCLQSMLSNKLNNTAILIFANSPCEELKHKPFAKDGNLFNSLTKRTLKIVKKAALPYFHITEKQQLGNSFGERFVNSMQMVFDQGFDNVITIGNDTPLLKTVHLVEAHRVLQNKKPILGPSTDGGFYLLGLHRSQFDPVAFKNLPWQTSNLIHKLIRLLHLSNLETVYLPTLFDLDKAADLKILVRFTRQVGPTHKKIILFLTTPTRGQVFSDKFNFVEISDAQIPFNKGSPISF